MAYLDAVSIAGGTSGSFAADAVSAKANEVVLAYGDNSNTAVNPFGAPWNDIPSLIIVGRFAWLKTLAAGPVSLSYSVPGTQAWALWMASFGSNANPVFTRRAANNNAIPFSVSGLTFTAKSFLIAVFEFESNNSGPASFSVSDSQGNNWLSLANAVGQRIVPPSTNQLAQATSFYVEKAIGGSGITFSVAGPSTALLAQAFQLYEVSGLTDSAGARLLLSQGVGV